MKQLVNNFKNYILDRWIIVKTSVISSAQVELAYPANNWSNIFSTLAYTITSILFINVLFSNVTTFAGYNKDEMLVFFIIGQLTFYIEWLLSLNNLGKFTASINSGSFDLLLTKPLPALFYTNFRTLNLISTIRDLLPNVLLVVFVIDWSILDVSILNFFIGILIFIFGILITINYQLILTLPVFWIGFIDKVMEFGLAVEYEISHQFPYEAIRKYFGFFFFTLLPIVLVVGGTTSVILGKLPALPTLLVTLTFSIISGQIKFTLWKIALKHYSSASS